MNNVFWNYGGEGFAMSTVLAVIGTTINAALGGFDRMLYALMIFMVLDFVLGFMAACKEKAVDSRVMFWGGVNKLLVLSLVAIGVCLDWLLGHADPWIRTAVIWFYISREFLSVTENYGRLGFKLPPVVSDVLAQINRKAEERADPVIPKEEEDAKTDNAI